MHAEQKASWTLFLDRDGVINTKRESDYVKTLDEWEWRDDFLNTIKPLSEQFECIVVVTNQRGIGRGIMTEKELHTLHKKMLEDVLKRGGRIDGIFYCPHDISENCPCRKPKTGLALQAKKQFPDIDFSRSVLIGDSESDIELGNTLGMKTYLLTEATSPHTKALYTIKNISDILPIPGRVGGG